MALIASIAGTVIGLIMAALGAQSMAEYYAVDYEPMPIHYAVPLYGAAHLHRPAHPVLCGLRHPDHQAAAAAQCGGSAQRLHQQKGRFQGFCQQPYHEVQMEVPPAHPAQQQGTGPGGAHRPGSRRLHHGHGADLLRQLRQLCQHSVNSIGSFSYRYYLTSYETKEQGKGCETYINESLQPKDIANSQFSLSGLQKDSKYITLTDLDGKKVSLKDGDYYLTEMAAKVYGLSAGDQVHLLQPHHHG